LTPRIGGRGNPTCRYHCWTEVGNSWILVKMIMRRGTTLDQKTTGVLWDIVLQNVENAKRRSVILVGP